MANCGMGPLMKEHRRSQRFQLTLRLTIIGDGPAGINKTGETRNLSSKGVYFVVADGIELGSLLEFIVTLPEDVSPVRLLCQGRVVRVEHSEQSPVSVAATIERYEFLRDGPELPSYEISQLP